MSTPDLGQLAADHLGGTEAFVEVIGGHAYVDDGDVRTVRPDLSQKLFAVPGLADDLVAGILEQPHGSGAHQDRVLADHDAHGISAVNVVPAPGALATVNTPPCA